ncbi:hypothetical protein GF406_07240 [candidate division KSB1 bacterium]|nr:hypothetical protein [candidate division KSB1 bacterium]
MTIKKSADCKEKANKKFAAELEYGGKSFHVYFEINSSEAIWRAEAFITAALFPAMHLGMDIHCPFPISKTYLKNLCTIQDILLSWFPDLRPVKILPEKTITSPLNGTEKQALFFSGGLDSSYSLLKHLNELDALIFVNGFDISLNDVGLYRNVRERLYRVARAKHKKLVIVHTNLREFLECEMSLSWPDTHGLAMASVAHLLSSEYTKILISATACYADLYPYGSHPLLDPLWGTETLEIVHDGCEADRVQKAKYVAKDEIVRSVLRVCWENRNGAFNCCECEKCVRTMVQLEIAGVLLKFPSFNKPLNIDNLNCKFPAVVAKKFRTRYLPELETSGHNPRLLKKLYSLLYRKPLYIRILHGFRKIFKI